MKFLPTEMNEFAPRKGRVMEPFMRSLEDTTVFPHHPKLVELTLEGLVEAFKNFCGFRSWIPNSPVDEVFFCLSIPWDILFPGAKREKHGADMCSCAGFNPGRHLWSSYLFGLFPPRKRPPLFRYVHCNAEKPTMPALALILEGHHDYTRISSFSHLFSLVLSSIMTLNKFCFKLHADTQAKRTETSEITHERECSHYKNSSE